MTRHVSRRRALRLTGVGVTAGLAGCSTEALSGESAELLVKLRNSDQTADHEVRLELIRSDAAEFESGLHLRRDITLAKMADTASGEEYDDRSDRDVRVESQPYRVRVLLNAPRGRNGDESHYHYRPCVADTPSTLERLSVEIVRESEDIGPEIRFYQPC